MADAFDWAARETRSLLSSNDNGFDAFAAFTQTLATAPCFRLAASNPTETAAAICRVVRG